jgi:two-component system, NarL family, sensor histidine kinase DesK
LSLADEVDSAATLLDAAGIRTEIKTSPPDLGPTIDRVPAWTVREDVTNVLRHSNAEWCMINADGDSTLYLEITNDHARPQIETGSGLAGLTERVHELAGSFAAGPTPGGGFRLRIDIPLDAI